MQKYYLLLVFTLLSVGALAQNQRFIYEYSYSMDSLNRQKTDSEIMNLDVTKEGSNFYSSILIKRDSLLKAEFEKGKVTQSVVIDMRKIRNAKVKFRVSKKYPEFETIYHTSVNAVNVAIKENQKINWTIYPETKSIETFKAQKAAASFGGRNWIAWFTNDIEIQDGPYKFSGLPGLILSVEDDKGDHVFRLTGSQPLNSKNLSVTSQIQEIFVTTEKFNKLWNEYKKDPTKNIKLIHGSSGMSETIFSDPGGNPLTKQDLITRKEQGAKENLKNYNNYVEIELYK